MLLTGPWVRAGRGGGKSRATGRRGRWARTAAGFCAGNLGKGKGWVDRSAGRAVPQRCLSAATVVPVPCPLSPCHIQGAGVGKAEELAELDCLPQQQHPLARRPNRTQHLPGARGGGREGCGWVVLPWRTRSREPTPAPPGTEGTVRREGTHAWRSSPLAALAAALPQQQGSSGQATVVCAVPLEQAPSGFTPPGRLQQMSAVGPRAEAAPPLSAAAR